MSEFRIKDALSQITGALEANIQAIETSGPEYRESSGSHVRMFDESYHPDGSYVLQFRTDVR